jgi:Ca2+-dependent lipid-binding protein
VTYVFIWADTFVVAAFFVVLVLTNIDSVYSKMDPSDLSLLIEIVSCQNLIQADVDGGSDPYVKVKLGDKDVHKTKYISNK